MRNRSSTPPRPFPLEPLETISGIYVGDPRRAWPGGFTLDAQVLRDNATPPLSRRRGEAREDEERRGENDP